MVKLMGFYLTDNIFSFLVLIEGDREKAYEVSIDIDSDTLSILASEIPDEYKIYERQARVALMEQKKKYGEDFTEKLPNTIVSAWC